MFISFFQKAAKLTHSLDLAFVYFRHLVEKQAVLRLQFESSLAQWVARNER